MPRRDTDTRSRSSSRPGRAACSPFTVASLYPLLYRMEERGWIVGRWVERAGQRRRRYYSITKDGRTILDAQRKSWREFVAAMGNVVRVRNA